MPATTGLCHVLKANDAYIESCELLQPLVLGPDNMKQLCAVACLFCLNKMWLEVILLPQHKRRSTSVTVLLQKRHYLAKQKHPATASYFLFQQQQC